MVLEAQRQPLVAKDVAAPQPSPTEVLIEVQACAVCRTDLHIVEADLKQPKLPLIPGHEIVGRVVERGDAVTSLAVGQLVGVPWLGKTCGACYYCRSGRENLCDHPVFTGYQKDGGYASFCTAEEHFCFGIPPGYSAVEAAPLLCAGLIGWRSYKFACADSGDTRGKRLGVYGFGAAAHILVQVAKFQGNEVYAFTRDGDGQGQEFARSLGAAWAGDGSLPPPEPLDAAIIFAPAGDLVPLALKAVRKGGAIVCGGISMSDIPAFAYDILWGERSIKSVANLTRRDGIEFLEIAPKVPVKTVTTAYRLEDANQALDDLRQGRLKGAAVLVPP